ncbi:hypothetical protein BpHYR1_004586 [Brachionus plicatilis]|uniref:RNA-directed DNA polymerase from mobile element jockey-like n=1 Tax=Brachionus plicatilis TaxID=10195 RepID=A0A3M7PAY5_BRAPC|nr:hypothetical protein BpHYR1_004586 [Brachionus plicatilis]
MYFYLFILITSLCSSLTTFQISDLILETFGSSEYRTVFIQILSTALSYPGQHSEPTPSIVLILYAPQLQYHLRPLNPIPKKGVTTSVFDYRPFSVSNPFSTILESLLLSNMRSILEIHPNRFGYKSKTSCIDLNLGDKIVGINASVVAYCDDIAILSPLASHAQKNSDRIYEYSLLWKIEFNAKKSSYLFFKKKQNNDDAKNFKLGELVIPLQKGIIYLGLPLGDLNFINSFIDTKMRDVEKKLDTLENILIKKTIGIRQILNNDLSRKLFKEIALDRMISLLEKKILFFPDLLGSIFF